MAAGPAGRARTDRGPLPAPSGAVTFVSLVGEHSHARPARPPPDPRAGGGTLTDGPCLGRANVPALPPSPGQPWPALRPGSHSDGAYFTAHVDVTQRKAAAFYSAHGSQCAAYACPAFAGWRLTTANCCRASLSQAWSESPAVGKGLQICTKIVALHKEDFGIVGVNYYNI